MEKELTWEEILKEDLEHPTEHLEALKVMGQSLAKLITEKEINKLPTDNAKKMLQQIRLKYLIEKKSVDNLKTKPIDSMKSMDKTIEKK